MASEILGVTLKAGLTNTESVLLNGVNGHTYTILSITFCETAGAAETVNLYIDDDGGGTDYEILSDQALAANETFEYTGRIVIVDTDHLCAATANTANVDVVVSYLDQTR
jgi:septin family protein